jgi:PPK2 family polyphosphate:nucleotide phosphotransferase
LVQDIFNDATVKLSYSKLFQVKPGRKVNLGKADPDFTAVHTKKKSAGKEVDKLDRKLRDFQYLLYAEGKQSLLICLQALDGAGKDGLINHVLGAMNPQGARVHGFKAPTKEEASQDFLWRIEKQAPRKGEVVIFNRSHYEDVLVARVHRLVPAGVWQQRFARINAFEKSLVATGTHELKFFLHISPEEQLRRFTRRLGDPTRQWKISEGDYEEPEFWDDYTQAYEESLSWTSTRHAPRFVIPSNNKSKRSANRSRTLPAAKAPRKTGAAPPVKTPVLEPAPEPVAWIGS